MDCDTCGRQTRAGARVCRRCRRLGDQGPRLVTDGGEDADDDPLSDPTDEDADESEYEYLGPEDIVDDEEPPDHESTDDTAGGSADRQDKAQSSQEEPAGEQPPAGQSGGGGNKGPPDGGQPREQQDQSQGGQPRDQRGGQPQGGQPRNQQGQPQGGQPRDAQQGSQAGQPQGGQPRDDQQPASVQGGGTAPPTGAGGSGAPTGTEGAPLGGNQTQKRQPQQTQPTEEEEGLVEALQEYPLKLGTALGAVAFLIPYILITLGTVFAHERPPGEGYEELGLTPVVPGVERLGWQFVEGSQNWSALDVSAELFFYVAELGPGDAVIDLFRRSADVVPPSEVDPADYPTVQDELGPLLDLLALEAHPEVPLLLLYIIGPYVLFLSGRYLARNYTPGERAIEYAVAGGTVTIGTAVVTLLLGLVFPVTNLAFRLLFAGLLVPGVIGSVGGLTIYSLDDHSALVSTLTGWAAVGVGFAVAFLLLPLPELPDGAELQLSLLDRIVFGVGAYLNAIQFNIGSHTQGRIMFVLAVVVTVAAGFLRTWQARNDVRDRLDGVRVGGGIFFGFLGTVALLLWAFPMGTALTNLGLSTQVGGSTAFLHLVIERGGIASGPPSVDVPTVQSVISLGNYLKTILVAGIVFPVTFGGLGGYAAVWYRDR